MLAWYNLYQELRESGNHLWYSVTSGVIKIWDLQVTVILTLGICMYVFEGDALDNTQ